MLRGQSWVKLHGDFTLPELETLVKKLKENCEGLGRNDNKKRPND